MFYTSHTLSLTGNESQLECIFFPPIEVGDRSEIGLLSMQTYNSIPNVGSDCNTLVVVDTGGVTKIPVKIPTGCYEIITLEAKIREILGGNVEFFDLATDSSSLKCVLHCSNDIELDVENSIAPLLGFNTKRTLKAHFKHESDHVVKIMSVNSIKVDCNLALGSYHNGQQSHTIHEFYPEAPPGYKIVEIPKYCILYELKTSVIDHVRVSLTDQNGKLINFQGETINVRLLVKKNKNNGSQIQRE